MKILGIETSCDETGIALYDGKQKKIIAEQLYSQASKHSKFGGVVPELASRDHVKKLLPLLKMLLEQSETPVSEIDGIAYTSGPGLRGPLLTGASFAHALSYGWSIPCVGIHHMEAHLLINLLEKPAPEFPFLTLLISGGHCLLIKSEELGSYQILGQSRDDAVGEAFDKVAKLLGLGYPGGPLIEELAKKGDPNSFVLPRPMSKEPHLDFSFSGLKTAVLYTVKKQKKEISENFKADIAASFQEAVAETLLIKCKKGLEDNKLEQLVVGGGVAANQYIRERFEKDLKGIKIFFPPISKCTDNGAMVAVAGYYRLKKEQSQKIEIKPKWDLAEI